MWERELNELIQASQVKSQVITDMPFTPGGVSDNVAETAVQIIAHTEMVEAMRLKIQRQINEVDKYISSLDDSFLKQIIQYRCCKLMTWDRVAAMIGAGTSADSCRMYYNRKIPKE